ELEEGDSFTALVWLTEALRLDRGQPEIERKHRTWISLALQHCPRLVQLLTCNRRVLRAQVGSWGCWVTTAGDDGAIRILDMMTGLAAGPGFKPENGSLVVGISPDGRLIATAAADGTTQVWNRDSGELLGSPIHHAGPVVEASVSADDRVLLIRDTHSMVQLWDLSTRRGIPLDVGPEGVAVDAASSDDGYWLFTVHAGGRGRMWNTRTGRAASPALELGQHMVLAAPSADGRRVALIDADSGLWLLDAQTGNSRLLVASLRSEGMVNRVTFSPNGSPVLTVAGNRMRVWDAASGVPVAPPLWQRDTLLSAAFAGEQRLVAVGKDGVLRVWELPLERKASGKPGAERSATTGPKTVRAPRRIQLTDGMVIQVRTPATGAPVQPPRSYDRLIEHAAFSPDARRVATAIDGRTIQVWDTATGTPLAAPLVHKEIPAYVAFSPDGTRLVTASTARSVQVWDVGTGEPITPPLQHPYELRTVAFRSDGQRVVAVSTEGLERHWELTPDKRPVANLRSLAQVLSGRRHDGNSRLVPLDVAALRSAWDSSRPTSPNRASKPIR
ncbi:MAG TPA: WD40 repeat domain-containing protein, partial [Gemmataceae bacterium]|nr:WD40 repeat domain-containing protein [Gemmataceae bacterium]